MPREVALHQRDAGALHRDVGAGAHGDADVGLRERRRVVDAVARHRHDPALACEPLDHLVLAARAAPRRGSRRCRACAATASAVVRLSPVSMTMRRPSARSACERLRACVGLDRVGDAEQAGRLAVDGDEHHGLRPRRAAARPARRARRGRPPGSRSSARLPSATSRPVDRAEHALAGRSSRSRAASASSSPRSSAAADDRGRQRMLARPLEAGREPQQVRFVDALRPAPAPSASACLRSACRSCRPPACRPWRSARAPRRS